jgi:ATP-dependent Clp protease protease subunit
MAEVKKQANVMAENRIIYLNGAFNEEKAKSVITQMLTFDASDPSKDILLFIDSYGGHVHSLLAIHDIIHLLRCDVATVCIGKAMSCGQMLLMSGTKGKRFITQNARVLVHEIATGTYGKLTDVEIDIAEGKELQKIFEKLIIKYTKVNKTTLNKLMERDSYMNAKESKDYGFIDHIITKPSDLYKKINL